MKPRIIIASGTFTAKGVPARVLDYEEVDGWIASERGADGEWTKWTRRADGAVTSRGFSGGADWAAKRTSGEASPWLRSRPDFRCNTRIRIWKTAAAARRAVDKEFPAGARALPAGGGK